MARSRAVGAVNRLAGKAALVTGAAGGIGHAIAVSFLREGAAVVAADSAADIAERAPEGAVAMRCDVSRAADARAAAELVKERFGSLHVLVNNAAIFVPYGSVVDVAEEDWTRSLAVNLTGPFLMSKYAVPLIAASGGGSIVHVASQLGQVGKPGHCWYNAAKGALIQLAKAMAIDHAGEGIRVNSLSPGPIGTPRVHAKHGGREAAERENGALTVLSRMGRPEEIAEAALFLASDESSYMTGADLLVDGGYNAW